MKKICKFNVCRKGVKLTLIIIHNGYLKLLTHLSQFN